MVVVLNVVIVIVIVEGLVGVDVVVVKYSGRGSSCNSSKLNCFRNFISCIRGG